MSNQTLARLSNQSDVPLGYGNWGDGASSTAVSKKGVDHDAKVLASAMNVAYAPGKNLMMTCFMLWMSGNQPSIMSMMMLMMAFSGPVKVLLNSIATRASL